MRLLERSPSGTLRSLPAQREGPSARRSGVFRGVWVSGKGRSPQTSRRIRRPLGWGGPAAGWDWDRGMRRWRRG
eukprot:352587-Chlamydomonas_euryale.AAC.9